jgi:hypothetical protein
MDHQALTSYLLGLVNSTKGVHDCPKWKHEKQYESIAVHGFIGVKTKLLNCVCGFEVSDLAQTSCDLLIEAACRPPLS